VGATTPTTGAFTYANFPSQSVAPATPSTGFTQYAASTGMFSWKGTNGFIRQFDASGITADRTWVLPNTAGTIALTSNLGTIASQNSNAVAITGGSIDGTTVGATTASTGAFTTLSASSTVSGAGFTTYLASPPAIGGTTASTGRFTTITSTIATGTAPFTVASTTAVANLSIGGNAGTVTNGVYTTDTGTVTNTMLAGSITNAKLVNSSITFGSTAQALGSTVSGISGVTIDNGIIGGTTAAAGTFTTLIGGGGSSNYEQITGGATGKAVQFQSLGSDAAVSLAIQSKGTGAIDLAAGSSGVNISNGGTVTAITRTAAGSGYTTIPSVAISAPTTAGGVQAVVTVAQMQIAGATIQSGGTGYTVGDTLTIVGGTPVTTAATLTVATVSGGVITSISVGTFTNYTALPTNPVSVTGGTGSGATFNVTYAVISFTIGTAGSGYVEQPTVTFSSGGGSGAAAYAAVGSGTVVKSLGSTMSFYTPGGESFRVVDNGSAIANFYAVYGKVAGQSPTLVPIGSDAAINATIASKSTGSVLFRTDAFSSNAIQMSVSNTASAVNYVNVTGAATTGAPTISSQGSDANPNVAIFPKGLGIVLMNQQTPAAVTATGTLTIANLLTQIITSTSAVAVALTLPTGTLSDAGVSGGTSAVNTSFDYSIINLGSAVGDVTMVAGTAHTIVGSATVAVGTSGRFRCRKTATNTFVSYRV
jgi:hypothetical protein